MSDNAVFETYLKTFAKTRASEVSETQKINFVSTDIAIDFFEEGKKIGEQEFKRKLKESFEKRIAAQGDATLDVAKQLANVFEKRGYIANKLFISLNFTSSKILFAIPEEQHYKEDFINLFYSLASELEDAYSKEDFCLSISAIDDSPALNLTMLRADGFSFGFDLEKEQKLF